MPALSRVNSLVPAYGVTTVIAVASGETSRPSRLKYASLVTLAPASAAADTFAVTVAV